MRVAISPKIRFSVFERDGFRCQYCGASPGREELEVDHVMPVVEGGGNEIANLRTACQPCNAGKRDRVLISDPDGDSLMDGLREQWSLVGEWSERIDRSIRHLVGYHGLHTVLEAMSVAAVCVGELAPLDWQKPKLFDRFHFFRTMVYRLSARGLM